MAKEILFKSEGREKMKSGIDKIVDAIKSTMGAAGRNVFLWRQFGAPHNTNDGYTIAKEIKFLDPVEDMGAQLVKEVAKKTVDEAGDGTSGASLLLQSIIAHGMDKVKQGCNVMNLKRGMQKGVDAIINKLKQLSIPADSDEKIIQIATISANNDREIGEKIAEAVKEVGKNGLITVEEGRGYKTEVQYADGMKLDNGFSTPHFINHNSKPVCDLFEPYILVYDAVNKVTDQKEIVPICEEMIKQGKSLLIIANVDGGALDALLINKTRGVIQVCAVNTFNHEIMEDIAAVTGATYISRNTNIKLKEVKIQHLGRAERISVSATNTEIINGYGTEDAIKKRIAQIESAIEASVSEFDTKNLKERLAKLDAGVAIIKVGGKTETEISEKKDRVDDAKCATIAALEEGYVAGGGTTFLHCIESINDVEYENEDERAGAEIIRKAIQYPFSQILTNAGLASNDYAPQIAMKPYGWGVNVRNNKVENLLETGVIDPTKVLRCSLENAASVAALFLTTECIVTENI